MAITSYDPQDFNLQTKALEQQSCDLAVSRAIKLVEDKTSVMVHRESRKICNEAFKTFEKNIQAAFPYDDYKDLILVTLKSRERLFFIDLKNRVISILSNSGQA